MSVIPEVQEERVAVQERGAAPNPAKTLEEMMHECLTTRRPERKPDRRKVLNTDSETYDPSIKYDVDVKKLIGEIESKSLRKIKINYATGYNCLASMLIVKKGRGKPLSLYAKKCATIDWIAMTKRLRRVCSLNKLAFCE